MADISGYNKKATDPISKTKNRAQQIAIDQKSKVGITLFDIDFAMMEYMTELTWKIDSYKLEKVRFLATDEKQ